MKMSSFYICVSKITIIWCMLPEIWVQSHNFLSFWVIFCPFTPLLAPKIKNLKKIRRYFLFHMCTINKDSWDIRHNRQKFCPFVPLINQKIKILKKWKKTPRDIIILHLSTTNDNHMMSSSWDMVFNRQNLFSFWTNFYPFTEKSKFWKKKPGDIISLPLCTTNYNHMMYGSLDIKCKGQSFLWTIFCPFDPHPLKTWKIKILIKWKKKKNNSWRYYHLYHYYINENHMMYGSWYMECVRQNFFLR